MSEKLISKEKSEKDLLSIKNQYKEKRNTYNDVIIHPSNEIQHYRINHKEQLEKELYERSLFERIINQKEFIKNEKWLPPEDINSRIIKEGDNSIFCECILDRENKIFEIREFNKLLFQHIKNIKFGKPIKIRYLEKAGSARIDIIDGDGFGIEKEFEDLQDSWDDLKEFDQIVSDKVKND